MKTRILALILAAGMLTALTACAKTPAGDTTDTGDTADTAETYNYSAGLDENGFFEGVKASDIVTLPEYKGIALEAAKVNGTEAEVQEQVDMVLDYYDTYEQVTDRAIEDGDTVNIDYVGSIDGVPFDGGNTGGQGTDVTIGVTQYIDDFLEQLIGHTPGENFDIEVTFPEEYGNEELNGKDAVFNITVNYIQGALIEAELTDDVAADYGFATVDELKADIMSWLNSTKRNQVFTELLAAAEVTEYPESVIEYYKAAELDNINYYASMYGITPEEYCTTYMGVESIDAYFDANMDAIKENARFYLAVQAIAEIEGLTVTEDDITELGYADYIETYGAPYIKQYLLGAEIVPAFVVDNAVIA